MELFSRMVGDFGRRLGMENLSPDDAGRVELRFDDKGRLMLEARDDIAFVTFARPWPQHRKNAALAAADLCHWTRNHPWDIHPGSRGDEWLTFTVALPVADMDLPVLETMVGYLLKMGSSIDEAK